MNKTELKDDFHPDWKNRLLFWGGFIAILLGFVLLYYEILTPASVLILSGYTLIGFGIGMNFKNIDDEEKE